MKWPGNLAKSVTVRDSEETSSGRNIWAMCTACEGPANRGAHDTTVIFYHELGECLELPTLPIHTLMVQIFM
jgi:hypothetical protein